MDEPPVPTELKIVLAFAPVEVVDDVVYRHAGNRRGGLRLCGGHKSEMYIVRGLQTAIAEPLADVSVTDIVHHGRSDGPGVAPGDALCVVLKHVTRSLAGELLRAS